MSNSFRGVSLLISADADHFAIDPRVLLHPAAYEPAKSRVILHETVHYWQQVSYGFLIRLAEENLNRLQAWERDGTLLPIGPRQQEYVRRYPDAGFSALDLIESMARYWDVHVLGPHLLLDIEMNDPRRSMPPDIVDRYRRLKDADRLRDEAGRYSNLAYHLAMDAVAGRYAEPYRRLLAMFPAEAAGLFPIVGTFAMHTAHPVPFFVRLARAAAPAFGRVGGGNIEDTWRECYGAVAATAVQLARDLDEILEPFPLLHTNGTALAETTVPYGWARRRLGLLIHGLTGSDRVKELAAERGLRPVDAAFQELTFLLCCPGMAENRGTLAGWLSPPVIRFPDGGRWLLTDLYRRELVPEVDEHERELSDDARDAADEAERIDDRWQDFLRACLRKGVPPVSPLPGPRSSAFVDAARVIAGMPGRQDPRLPRWLADVLDPRPAATPRERFGSFYTFAFAMLMDDPVPAEDVRDLLDMLITQLACRGGMRFYDSRSGLEWQWDGNPAVIAVAADLGRLVAYSALDDTGLHDRFAAVQLEALEELDLHPEASRRIGPLLRTALDLLRAGYRDSTAHREVLGSIQTIRGTLKT